MLGHALRLVYDELSSSEDTMMDINDVANEVREKLHGKSMSIEDTDREDLFNFSSP